MNVGQLYIIVSYLASIFLLYILPVPKDHTLRFLPVYGIVKKMTAAKIDFRDLSHSIVRICAFGCSCGSHAAGCAVFSSLKSAGTTGCRITMGSEP
jgi:hypothetical protein